MVTRRSFLGLAGVSAGAAVGGVAAWRALLSDHVDGAPTGADPAPVAGGSVRPEPSVPATPGRALVVVQLGGGNDGLNTLIPAAQGRYHDLRPTLAVAEDEVLALDGEARFGFHPALGAAVPLWQAGRLAAVTGVGFPDQSRSHFQAMDTWWSGRADASTTGWLGRWLDATATDDNPLRAVALGSGSPALIGERSTATVVLDPAAFALRAPRPLSSDDLVEAFVATAAPLAADPVVAAAQGGVGSAFEATDRLGAARADETGDDDLEGGRTPITDLLGVAAGLLAQPIGTQIVLVGVSGFDTHARQATSHPRLLEDLAGGLARFAQAVEDLGRADDVLVVTTSEFGRRAADNGSGTDHGNAGTQFLAGRPVGGATIVGEAPLDRLADGDLPIVVDTASLYAECLDWLGGPTDEVLGGSPERLGVVRS